MSAGAVLRLGIVGCGRLAELGYVPAAAGIDEVEIVALADPARGRCEELARVLASVSIHDDAASLLAEAGVDAIVLTSPPAAHPADAELAAAAGVPCLIEKPPAPGLAGAERIAALGERIWIGFNRRFQHGVAIAPAIPAAGALGLDLELRYRRASWRAHAVRDEALLDLAPHLVDLALLLTGSKEAEVRRAAINEARVELELETPRGSASIRCATDRPHRERVVVRDGRGRRLGASVAGGPSSLVLDRLPGRTHPLVASLRAQLGAFARAVRGGDAGLLATAADGVRTMRVIESARRSASSGQLGSVRLRERPMDVGGRA